MPGLSELRLGDIEGVPALAGAVAMALHVAMLESGEDLLLFHTWDPPALSLGRFQTAAGVRRDRLTADGMDLVRRPTGGGAILHAGDLTYAVTLASTGKTLDDYARVAAALRAGLARLGVAAQQQHRAGPPRRDTLCFASASGSDLRVGAAKVCGSAQVRRHGRVLQHGSLPLDARPFGAGRYLDGPPVTGHVLRADAPAVAAALRAGFHQALGPVEPATAGVEAGVRARLDAVLQRGPTLKPHSRVGP